jgi:hypothetical protein
MRKSLGPKKPIGLQYPDDMNEMIRAKLILHCPRMKSRIEHASGARQAMHVGSIIKAIEHENVVATFGVSINTPVDLPETRSFNCQPLGLVRGNYLAVQCNHKIVRQKARIAIEARRSLRRHKMLRYVINKCGRRRWRTGCRCRSERKAGRSNAPMVLDILSPDPSGAKITDGNAISQCQLSTQNRRKTGPLPEGWRPC